MDKGHHWHMAEGARLAEPSDELRVATTHHLVDLADSASTEAATHFWIDLAARGGEGMVVKSRAFIAREHKGIVYPVVSAVGRNICASSMDQSTTSRSSSSDSAPRPR